MPHPDEQRIVSALLAPLRSPVVVELGAHTGEDEQWIRGSFREACYYLMVEPDPRNCQAILNRHKSIYLIEGGEDGGSAHLGNLSTFSYTRLGSRKLLIGAVADECGFREFHFSRDVKTNARTSGSLRRPTGHLKHFPQIAFEVSGMVPTYTLDWIFEHECLPKIDLLWVDIQGAEDMMIRGGQTALKHTRYLFMEVEQEELYEGEGLRDDLVAMLPGWSVVEEFPYNILMRNEGFSERGAQ